MSQTNASTESQQYSQRLKRSQQRTGQQRTNSQQRVAGRSQTSGAVSGPTGQTFRTQSYLSESVRTSSIGLLNQCLADISALTMQLKAAHWNVKGLEFYQLHELFEDLIHTFDDHIDMVAERASALGGQPLGTARDVAGNTSIPPLPRDVVEGEALLGEIAQRIAVLDASLHEQIETASQQGDLDTADLLNEVSRDVSQSLWFVEAHLQGPSAGQATGWGGQQFLSDSQGDGGMTQQ